jgi:hypothetical protein
LAQGKRNRLDPDCSDGKLAGHWEISSP